MPDTLAGLDAFTVGLALATVLLVLALLTPVGEALGLLRPASEARGDAAGGAFAGWLARLTPRAFGSAALYFAALSTYAFMNGAAVLGAAHAVLAAGQAAATVASAVARKPPPEP